MADEFRALEEDDVASLPELPHVVTDGPWQDAGQVLVLVVQVLTLHNHLRIIFAVIMLASNWKISTSLWRHLSVLVTTIAAVVAAAAVAAAVAAVVVAAAAFFAEAPLLGHELLEPPVLLLLRQHQLRPHPAPDASFQSALGASPAALWGDVAASGLILALKHGSLRFLQ